MRQWTYIKGQEENGVVDVEYCRLHIENLVYNHDHRFVRKLVCPVLQLCFSFLLW
jgi:hypothetical protein